MDFKAKSQAYRERIEAGFDSLLPPAFTRPQRLHGAMRYSLEVGGKRLRPILTLATAEVYEPIADPLPAAVAIECIHTYSLIHDDLPAIDDSDLRRGSPTCHVEFDQATALLAGDALLTYAFQLLTRAYGGNPELAVKLVADLGEGAGSTRLIGGQMEDIIAERSQCTEEQLTFIHKNKTAALITVPIVMGLRCTTADASQIAIAEKLGFALGMAYQIIDDILDATATTLQLGKPAGLDQRNQKSTYVTFHGLDASREQAQSFTREAIDHCKALDGDTAYLEALIASLETRIQ